MQQSVCWRDRLRSEWNHGRPFGIHHERCQRPFDGGRNASGCDRRAISHRLVARAGHFGGQDIIPPAARIGGVPRADDRLGPARGFLGDRVDRVHLGRVDEVDALADRVVELLPGFVQRVLR